MFAQLEMVYSSYIKQRILYFHCSGRSYSDIVRKFLLEGHHVTKSGISYFLKVAKERNTPLLESHDQVQREIIDDQMEEDEETTALELQQLLKSKLNDTSLSSILQWR